jgi:DNA polymerase-3 subunit alpha
MFGGHIAQLFLNNELKEAENIILKHVDIFKDNYYLELQEHGLEGQREYNEFLIKQSKKHNILTIIQNDAHYLTEEDAFAHEVLLCKNTASKMSDPKRWKFGTNQAYCKTKEQLKESFFYLSDKIFETCIENTNIIADKCEEIDIVQKKYNYPVFFDDPKESFKKLVELTKIGFNNRFKGQKIDLKTYKERLIYELNTIKQTGFLIIFICCTMLCNMLTMKVYIQIMGVEAHVLRWYYIV